MKKPWFHCDWAWEPDTIPSSISTEDFHFYTKAKSIGYKVWCDTTVQCGHEDRESKVSFWLTEDMPQVRDDIKASDIKKTDRLCADLGCGYFSEHWDGILMRYDEDEACKPDIRCDIRQVPEPPERFDEVRASHVLEHFTNHEAPACLKEWLRILKVGGKIVLKVPNLAWAMETILRKEDDEDVAVEDMWYAWGTVYGGMGEEYEKNPLMRHKNGYTPRNLKNLFKQVGGTKDVIIGTARNNTEVVATAIKTHTPKHAVLLDFWNEMEKAGEPVVKDRSPVDVTAEGKSGDGRWAELTPGPGMKPTEKSVAVPAGVEAESLEGEGSHEENVE